MGVADHVLESISGHLSRRMLEHNSHIRIDAKRQALDALDAARRSTAHNGDGNGDGANQTEIPAIVKVSDDLTSPSRHSLILRGSPPAGKLLIPLARRDVRVVEGARLESDCGQAHRAIPKHLLAHRFNDFPPQHASPREPVNVGVCRRFRGGLTQFLHSSRLHFPALCVHVRPYESVPTSCPYLALCWLFTTNKENTMTKATATHRRFALTSVSTGVFDDPLSGVRRIRATSSGRSNDEKWPVRGRVIR